MHMKPQAPTRIFLFLLVFAATLYFFPSFWCGRSAFRWLDEDERFQKSLAQGVEQWVDRSLSSEDYRTGSSLFNGEWLFGTYMMAGMGFGQLAVRYPGEKKHYLEQMEKCIEKALSKDVRAFDRDSWREDPLEPFVKYESDKDSICPVFSDHAAYLGYLNLLLSFHVCIDSSSRYSDLNEKISSFLLSRIESSPLLLLQTYPAERYVIDNCAVVGSLGLYGKATGKEEYSRFVRRWTEKCRESYTDEKTGLLFQSVNGEGISYDSPRGSGSSLGVYFMSFADPDFSRDLYGAIRDELTVSFAGFTAVREYPRKVEKRGDIDSGPVVLGLGFSATGFSLAGAKIFGDRDNFRKIYALSHLFGTPHEKNGARHYVTGGPLGSAIMFAVLTSLPHDAAQESVKSL